MGSSFVGVQWSCEPTNRPRFTQHDAFDAIEQAFGTPAEALRIRRCAPAPFLPQRLERLGGEEQEPAADHDGHHAGPDGNVDGLFVSDLKIDRSKVGLMGALGVGEPAGRQPENTGYD